MTRLRIVDPYWGARLYPRPVLNGDKPARLTEDQRALLLRLAVMRADSHVGAQWDQVDDTVCLLNQASFPLQPPVNWQARPVPDLLWAFQLHGWDWAWPALCDEEGRHSLLALWQDWLDQIPIGRGVAWEPYPTSRRLIVWSAAWHFVGRDPNLAAAIGQQAAFLADHLERDLDNNHLVANAKALAWVGLLLPNLSNASKWRKAGLAYLWQTLESQVRNDGSHCENSTGYHMAVWLDGLETALLAGASGEWVPETAWQTLEKMGDFALALRRPDGRLPMLNDAVEDEPAPAASLFALAADAFDRSDLAWAAGHPDAKPPQQQSVAFADAGYVILRQAPHHSKPICSLMPAIWGRSTVRGMDMRMR
ncbi:MAG: heparinase II/III family protein [Caldilineaceae bacterium]